MPDARYDRDALLWSEQQSDLLRRLAAGERVNDAVDWPHVIEEVYDVGLSELRACQSLLQQAMAHLLKLRAWPDSLAARHWREEASVFLDDAARRYTPSMRQRIELNELYATALRRVRGLDDASGSPNALAEVCPYTLTDLLTGDVPALLRCGG